ncbi:hatching enzyme 1.2-like [Anopheles bellator]|uniref:hatching enzyme 1.2-like n=1 Tax=Anopheles bellator TaxID=139047 RepID=UPI0026471B00|nr:hatching enzyme 1.2-like [Anopheles bellator]
MVAVRLSLRFAVYLVVVFGWQQAIDRCAGNVILNDNSLDETEPVIDLSHLGPELYGLPDEAVGKRVAEFNPATDGGNVEELGSYLEGDILIDRPEGRNGLASTSTRWPNGVVPFVISGNFDAKGMQLIEEAMKQFHAKTCIRFKPRMAEKDYISIESSSSGCWSSVGRIGGKQTVNLQIPGCTSLVGTAIHELTHAVGFLHEQNREDRDGYVTIRHENIKAGTASNFDKAQTGSTNSFGVQYDYGSIMHYSENAFSSNGKPTIVAKEPLGDTKMGQRDGFSWSDMEKISRMYNCQKAGTGGGSGGGGDGGQLIPRPPSFGLLPSNGGQGYPGTGYPAGSATGGGVPYYPQPGAGPYYPYGPNAHPFGPYRPNGMIPFGYGPFGYGPYDEVGEPSEKAESNTVQ